MKNQQQASVKVTSALTPWVVGYSWSRSRFVIHLLPLCYCQLSLLVAFECPFYCVPFFSSSSKQKDIMRFSQLCAFTLWCDKTLWSYVIGQWQTSCDNLYQSFSTRFILWWRTGTRLPVSTLANVESGNETIKAWYPGTLSKFKYSFHFQLVCWSIKLDNLSPSRRGDY